VSSRHGSQKRENTPYCNSYLYSEELKEWPKNLENTIKTIYDTLVLRLLMPVMAKCKNCGFEFPTKQITFGSEENKG
jgi:predicted Zn-ribbon and HTH transcriptional regulator